MFGNGVDYQKQKTKNGNIIQWNVLYRWKLIACYNPLGVIISMCKKLCHSKHLTIIVSTTRMLGSNSGTHGLSLIPIIFHHIFLWSYILRNLLLFIYIHLILHCLHCHWTLSINSYFTRNKSLFVNLHSL